MKDSESRILLGDPAINTADVPSPLAGEGVGEADGWGVDDAVGDHSRWGGSCAAAEGSARPLIRPASRATFSRKGRRNVRIAALSCVSLLAAGLMGCEPDPRLPQYDRIAEHLSKREGHRVIVYMATAEHRDGHQVVCGFYSMPRSAFRPTSAKNPRLLMAFGAVDGRVLDDYDSALSPFVIGCHYDHYNGPLA